MGNRYLVLLVLGTILLSAGVSPAHSSTLSDPEKVNDIIPEIHTPRIDPGSSGEVQITLNNPYNETIENVSLTIDVYGYEYLDKEKDISEVDEPPVFEESEKTNITISENSIESGSAQTLQPEVRSKDGTEEGVYLLRFELEFDYLKNNVTMKSRGCFAEEEWEETKVEDDEEHPGGFNLTKLGVDGILSDSSFSVKSTLPRWPQYALGAVVGISGVLAVMFYMQEKYGSFPRLEKTFDNWSSKFKKIRRHLEKRFD